MDPVRCFVALCLPPGPLEVLSHARDELQQQPWAERVRWVRDENLHLTLHFLGELPVAELAAVAALLRARASGLAPIAGSLAGVGGLPSPTRARVVVAGIRTRPRFADWVTRLRDGLGELGLPREARRFRPHVTLGRVRRPPLRGVRVDLPLPATPFEAREIVLYRSELLPEGARYTPLETLRLD